VGGVGTDGAAKPVPNCNHARLAITRVSPGTSPRERAGGKCSRYSIDRWAIAALLLPFPPPLPLRPQSASRRRGRSVILCCCTRDTCDRNEIRGPPGGRSSPSRVSRVSALTRGARYRDIFTARTIVGVFRRDAFMFSGRKGPPFDRASLASRGFIKRARDPRELSYARS